MDAQRLPALSRLPHGARRAWRVQRQVHDQPNGPARKLACDARRPCACELSQLPLSTGALGVQRVSARGLCRPRAVELEPGMAAPSQAVLRHVSVAPPASSLAREVIAGLTARPKRISPKYFYDEAGAQLFAAITATPEYYLTRCEIGILQERASEIARFIPAGAALVEFGSGSSQKARVLIAAAPAIAAYVPVDISSKMLIKEAQELRRDRPALAVLPVEADFTQPFSLTAEGAGLAP